MAARSKPRKKTATPRADLRTSVTEMTSDQLYARLAEIARIGSLFIEGEDCINALQSECREWTNPDDINYDAAVAVPLKKTLLRIEMIGDFPYFAIVWTRRTDDPEKAEIVLAGSKNSARSVGKRDCPKLFPALRTVFEKGRAAKTAMRSDGYERVIKDRFGHARMADNDSLIRGGKRVISYFHPIRDSREEVVAALELTCVGSDG